MELIGRDEVLAELAEALAASRLVTLTGPGGIGKTALAEAVAARIACEVRVVELAAVPPDGDPETAIIDALGIRSDDLRPALAGRELLLVLDNCEHLVEAVAQLTAELLDSCPGLRILATSREALRIKGETRFAVPALATGDAVRLFTKRAADRSFRLDAATLPLVERICELLDGLPLAIELAAGRVDSVALSEIAAALAEADPRTGLDRGTGVRQDGLRVAIGWSWELLPPVERVLAARLAVFAGGTTADSLAAVLELPRPVAANLLASLAERSLVTLSNGRYRMPETIRAYAGERLTSDETSDLQARHAAYLLGLVDEADQHLRGPDQLHWATLLRAEGDNLRTVIGWAVEHDPRLALRLVAGLSTYWWMHGLRGEAGRAARPLLAVLGSDVPDGLGEEYLLTVLHAASSGRHDLGDHTDRAQQIVGELAAPFRHPVTVLLWSVVLGPYVPPALIAEVLARNELSNDPWTLAALQICAGYPGLTGVAAVEPGIFEAALARFQVIGDRWGVSLALNALAELAAWSDRLDLSSELLGQALSVAVELDSDEDAALLLCRRGDLRLRLGKLGAASEDYSHALVLAERAGLPDSSAAARIGLARAARYDGELGTARKLALTALSGCPAGWVGADLARAEILSELAAIAKAEGHQEETQSWLLQAGLAGERV